MIDVAWIERNAPEIAATTGLHVVLSVLPVVLGLAFALPVGWLAHRTGRTSNLWLALIGLLYAIPSVALFVTMPLLLGTQILDPVNIVVALAVYTFALLVRNVADGFGSVDDHVRQSAVAMGYGPLRRVLGVELPLAMPVILAGLRVATVSTISLVSVGAVIGMGALGQYFDQGFREGFATPIVVGIVVIVLLALLADGIILFFQRVLLPWHGLGRRGAAR
ncbi:ABC transporter permease subunit [Mariniluteicoccus endophyticus]